MTRIIGVILVKSVNLMSVLITRLRVKGQMRQVFLHCNQTRFSARKASLFLTEPEGQHYQEVLSIFKTLINFENYRAIQTSLPLASASVRKHITSTSCVCAFGLLLVNILSFRRALYL